MAERVVDRLEAIEVDKECRERRALALAATDRAPQLFDEQAAIRKSGQLIELRAFLKLRSALQRLGHVAESDDAADQVHGGRHTDPAH